MKSMLILAAVTLLGSASLALAGDTTPAVPAAVSTISTSTAGFNPAIVKTVKSINANAVVKSIEPSPIAGLQTVVAGSSVLYISDDGRYVVYGVMLDTTNQRNLTDERLAVSREDLLKTIPSTDKIVFAPANKPTTYTVTVFTDTSCGYCQALHHNIQGYLDAGIRVEYVPWPRGGTQSPAFGTMQSVWCAKDQQTAFTTAINGGQVQSQPCARAQDLAGLYELGNKLGIEGTPAIYDDHGRQLGGFIPPDQMLAKLARDDSRVASAATK